MESFEASISHAGVYVFFSISIVLFSDDDDDKFYDGSSQEEQQPKKLQW